MNKMRLVMICVKTFNVFCVMGVMGLGLYIDLAFSKDQREEVKQRQEQFKHELERINTESQT